MSQIDVSPEGEILETSLGVLNEVFGFDAFRGPQADIVQHVSTGGDALVQGQPPRAHPEQRRRLDARSWDVESHDITRDQASVATLSSTTRPSKR